MSKKEILSKLGELLKKERSSSFRSDYSRLIAFIETNGVNIIIVRFHNEKYLSQFFVIDNFLAKNRNYINVIKDNTLYYKYTLDRNMSKILNNSDVIRILDYLFRELFKVEACDI